MSRPRDATSVATRTPVGLRLKRDMAELRSPWLLSPWIDITDADDDAMDGDCDRSPESDSQSSLVATKTMHRPIGARTGSISRSHWALALASGRTMTWLSTCSDEVPVLPTAILFFLRGEGESGKGKKCDKHHWGKKEEGRSDAAAPEGRAGRSAFQCSPDWVPEPATGHLLDALAKSRTQEEGLPVRSYIF
mmetsp:Transcript_22785/g.51652  ORF Transcript_22785/g.51652 Transcript_22785/m.51652 type:complete len:192 (-) Transcript_22785:1163-1738(-)